MQIINKLNFFCQPYGDLGIPIHSRALADEFKQQLEQFRMIPIFRTGEKLEKKYQDMVGKPDMDAFSLTFWYPNVYPDFKVSDINIGYYIFEYTKIPRDFVNKMNDMETVCTASKWGRDILIANGVRTPVVVFRGGGIASKEARKEPSDVFRFLHIGKFEDRKGTVQLIKCFNQAFEGNKDIRLTLSIDNPHVKGFSAEAQVAALAKYLKFPSNNVDIIHHVKNVSDLYLTHDCGVFPTKAEGIGLPIVESMAHGLPVITCYNTGITEYANDRNSILIKNLKEEPIYDQHFFPNKGEFGTWMSPSDADLIEAMKMAISNRSKLQEIGNNAKRFIAEEFSWNKSVKDFLSGGIQ